MYDVVASPLRSYEGAQESSQKTAKHKTFTFVDSPLFTVILLYLWYLL